MNKKSSRGFTIVELLVVIVVIGILAAITIVSYSGITARANLAKAQSNAQSAQSVAEIFYSDAGYYPVTTGAFATGSTNAYAKLPASITVIKGLPGVAGAFTGTDPLIALTAAEKASTVTWACSGGTAAAGNCAGNTGGRITFWHFVDLTGVSAASTIYVGAASATSTFFAP